MYMILFTKNTHYMNDILNTLNIHDVNEISLIVFTFNIDVDYNKIQFLIHLCMKCQYIIYCNIQCLNLF